MLAVALLLVIVFTSFHVHRYMQQVYFVHCKANVLRVVLLNRSTMCVQLQFVLQFIEHAYGQVAERVVKHLAVPLYHLSTYAASITG